MVLPIHFKKLLISIQKKIPMYVKVIVIIVGILLSTVTIKLIYTADLKTILTASPFIFLSFMALVGMWVSDD